MLHEQNVRLNRDHAFLVERAPSAWEDFKSQFRSECHEISRDSQIISLACDEPDRNELYVLRTRPYSQPVAVQRFTFKPSLPAISWTDQHNKKPSKLIEMTLDGSEVSFSVDGKPLILSVFIANRLEDSCR
ncbi:MAG TPA: hypothetical protein VHU89_09470 [Acidobacteriaceae bacterium]|jgi:hypothetical protein|nr:hypothetical protein [Acidobacteriaceae bacterium]